MTGLIQEIAEDFEYNGTKCDDDDCLTAKGIYTFEGSYLGNDVVIIAKYEDDDVVDYFDAFSCNPNFIPSGLDQLIHDMIKMFVKDGFIDWKETYG